MKVGDLVRSAYSDNKASRLGLIIEVDIKGFNSATNDFSGKHYKVLWGGDGTFWTPKDRLELIR